MSELDKYQKMRDEDAEAEEQAPAGYEWMWTTHAHEFVLVDNGTTI